MTIVDHKLTKQVILIKISQMNSNCFMVFIWTDKFNDKGLFVRRIYM